MVAKSIVDNRLWVRHDLDTTLKGNSIFQTNASHRAHLAAQLLLYDRIVIPTHDFGILPILLAWMGPYVLQDALETGAFQFIKLKTMLGYAGNGSGLSEYLIEETEEHKFGWEQSTRWGEIEEAADLQFMHQAPFLPKQDRNTYCQLTLNNSNEFKLERDVFIKNVRHETYDDVTSIPELVQFMFSHEPPGTKRIKPNLVSGVDKKQIRFLSHKNIENNIDLILRVGEINIELLMGNQFGKSDLCTSIGADKLLLQKLRRKGINQDLLENFLPLLQLNKIPDIRPAIEAGDITLPEIWKLRQNKQSQEFRKWLRASNPKDSRELEQAFVASLGNNSLYSSLPVRTLRFVVTQAASYIHPAAGPLSSAADIYLENWLNGYSPSLFMDDLRKLPI